MKKILFTLLGFSAIHFSQAQCTPDASLIVEAFGIAPDTTQNFGPAFAGVAYSQVIHFKAPVTVEEALPDLGITGTINTFTVSAVSGLPSGLSYQCSAANCTYAGGASGCAVVSGTPTTEGTYEITISVTASVTSGILTLPVGPIDFEGYKIVVYNDSLMMVTDLKKEVLDIYPNPVNELLNIGNMDQLSAVTAIRIINLEGRVMEVIPFNGASKIEVNTAHYKAGAYFVEVTHANGIERRKFIK